MAIEDLTFRLDGLDGNNGFRLVLTIIDYATGASISSAGDVNGDGYDDVIIGVDYMDPNGLQYAGSSYVVFGRAGGFSPSLSINNLNGINGFRIDGPWEFAGTGEMVRSAGDFNGDGFDDLIIGNSGVGPKGIDSGPAYIVFGKPGAFAPSLNLANLNGINGFRIEGEDLFYQFGRSVDGAGDVNGDGYDDVVIGSPGFDAYSQAGAIYVLFGKPSGYGASFNVEDLSAATGMKIEGANNNDRVGAVVSIAGDLNGDGYDDLLMSGNESVFVLYGKANWLSSRFSLADLNGSNGFRIDGEKYLDWFGYSLARAGDINNDGYDDIIVGAPYAGPENKNGAGSSYVLFGKPDAHPAVLKSENFDGSNGFRIDGAVSNERAGWSVSGAGDFNNDGYDDLLIGAPRKSTTDAISGAAYILFGNSEEFEPVFDLSEIQVTTGLRLDGVAREGEVGQAVSNVGDINGDGYADVIIASELVVDPLDSNNGKVFSYNGDGIADAIIAGDIVVDPQDSNGGKVFSYVVFGGERPTVVNNEPTGKVTIFGKPEIGETLTVTNSLQDTDGLGVINYQWNANDVPIEGADSYQLVLTEHSLGKSISVTAKYTDGAGFNESVSSNSLSLPHQNTVYNLSSLDGYNGFRLDGSVRFELSGESVSNAGDVNGDGFDDLIIGATGADSNGEGTGSVYVVFGSGNASVPRISLADLDGINGFRIDGVEIEDDFGKSVSGAGDFNGDGYDDLIIGAPRSDITGDAAGASYVVFGKPNGFPAALSVSNLNGQNGFRLLGQGLADKFGSSVSDAGDVNGDGFDDLIIGAPNARDNGFRSGSSYILFGKGGDYQASLHVNNLDGVNGFRLDGPNVSGYAGRSVSSAGDINGDGFDDLIIGAYRIDSNGIDSGSSYVFFGKESGYQASVDLNDLSGNDGFRLDGEVAGSYFGYAVSDAGDVNGDGYDDVIVGAVFGGSKLTEPGNSYVIFGKPNGFSRTFNVANLNGSNGFRLDGVGAGDRFGGAVSGAGDINNDGYDDLVVGAPSSLPGTNSNEANYIFYGKSGGFNPTVKIVGITDLDGFRLDGVAINNGPGTTVSRAGDVNGDGIDDLLVSAPWSEIDGGPYNIGSSYVIFGSTLPLQNLVDGGPGNDLLMGSLGKDAIRGYEGDDTLKGFSGNDVLEGGSGLDTAVYDNELAEFNVVNDDHEILVSNGEKFGKDTLTGIERLQFEDKSLAFDLDGNAGKVVKLLGVVLGAENWSNPEYIGVGLDYLDNSGGRLPYLMQSALRFILGDAPSNEDVVTLLYTSIMGRPPTNEETQQYAGIIDNGQYTQVSLALEAADHVQNLENIDIIGLTSTGVEYLSIG